MSFRSDLELGRIADEIIDLIASKHLTLTEKFRVVSSLHWSFKDTCKQAGFDIKEIPK